MTEIYPKTERGHRFHAHSNYDKLGVVKPNLEIKCYGQSYGMKNWDFHMLDDAVAHFYHKRFLPRIEHGYRLVIGNIPYQWLSFRK
ncbi:MAG: hypothetical protein C4291_09520 [Candidatus Dadabacteria bacterium]